MFFECVRYIFKKVLICYKYCNERRIYKNDFILIINDKEKNITEENIIFYLYYYWLYSFFYNLNIDICFYCVNKNPRIMVKRVFDVNRMKKILNGSIFDVGYRYLDFKNYKKEEERRIRHLGIDYNKKNKMMENVLVMYMNINHNTYDVYLDQEYNFYVKGNIILDDQFMKWYMIHYHNRSINDYHLEYLNINSIMVEIKKAGIYI